MPEKKKPAVSFGPYSTDRQTSIECAVWQNEVTVNEKPVTTFNVTIQRSYRDAQGNWQKNANFRPHDIPVLVHALQKAYDWTLEHRNGGSE